MKQIFSLLALIIIVAVVFTACKKSKEGKIIVYPNPATDYIIFDVSESSSYKNGEITVKDFSGQVVKVFATTDSSRIEWQVDTFDRGVYNYWYTADKMNTQTGKIQFN